jgi:GNAT superfamily N-acetyltransferase
VELSIREASPAQRELLAALIRESYRDVAERFALTAENAPTHPSNCQPSWIESDLARGVAYFVAEWSGVPCGCVALEHPAPLVANLQRLATLPGFRRRGIGRALVSHATAAARRLRAHEVHIGVIADHAELIRWYRRLGFAPLRRQTFDHLPFEVAFLSLPVPRGEEQ